MPGRPLRPLTRYREQTRRMPEASVKRPCLRRRQ
jgi:hypothetical protein